MLACAQSGGGEWVVHHIRRGDHDEVDLGVCRGFMGRAEGSAGEIGVDRVWVAGADDGEVQTRHGADQRSMEGPSRVAIADKGYADGGSRLMLSVHGRVYCLTATAEISIFDPPMRPATWTVARAGLGSGMIFS
jgi:hypothetical protein